MGQQTGRLYTLPASDNVTPAATSTPAYAATAWTEVGTIAASSYLASICPANSPSIAEIVEVGMGPSADDVTVVARVRGLRANEAESKLRLPAPIALGVNATLWLRVYDASNSITGRYQLEYYETVDPEFYLSGKAVYCAPGLQAGVTVTPSGSAWGDSAWVEVTAGLANPVGLFSLAWDAGGPTVSAELEWDIGTGAGPTVVTTIRLARHNGGRYALPFPVLFVAADTPISVRLRKSDTNTTTLTGVGLNYYDDVEADTFVVPEPTFVDGAVSYPLVRIDLTDRTDATTSFAEVDLNDPADYAYGYKAPWVIRFLPITRGLSDRMGQLEHLSFGALLSDTTRWFRSLLAGATTKFLTNRPLAEWIIGDEERRALGLWRLIANGFVADYGPRPDLQFELRGSDWLAKKFSRKRKAQQSWQPLIVAEDFGSNVDVPLDVLNTPAPLWYGVLSDESVTLPTLSPPTNLTATVIGGAGSYTYTYAVTNCDNRNQQNSAGKITDHAGETEGTYVTVTNAPSLTQMSVSRYVHLTWTNPWDLTAAAANHYFSRVYGRSENGQLNLLDQGKGSPGAAGYYDDDEDHDREKTSSHPPVTNQSGGGDAGRGVVPVIYVGKRDDAYEWLVCRCAIKSIDALYLDGVRVSDALVAANFYVPGTAEWTAAFGATDYVDFNSRRYTVIRGIIGADLADKVANAEAVLTLNIQGIETNGDGSGSVIASIPAQHLHFVNNFIAPDTPYQSGAYLTAAATVFPTIPELTLVDSTSFTAAETAIADRLTGGYEGAGGIGHAGEFVSAVDAIARFCVSGDHDQFFNRKGQYAISVEPRARSGEAAITDVINIVDRSFEISDRVQREFFNVLPYVASKDYTGNTTEGWKTVTETRSDSSIANYDQEREAPRTELHFGRTETAQGAATVLDVMARRLARTRDPRRVVQLTVPLSGLEYEPGDSRPITHLEGIGASGWTDHEVRFARHEVEPTEGRVKLEAYDLEALFAGLGRWAPEDAPDWADASEEERQAYLYFAPETGGTYASDGAQLKTWM